MLSQEQVEMRVKCRLKHKEKQKHCLRINSAEYRTLHNNQTQQDTFNLVVTSQQQDLIGTYLPEKKTAKRLILSMRERKNNIYPRRAAIC